jgi:hypothetical protein
VADGLIGGTLLVGTAVGIKGLLSSGLRGLFGGGCFAAGTPILTPEGSRMIETIRPGDWVMAAPDDDPHADPVPRQVEEIFENYLPTLDLHVNGRIIRTTAEHPFWVRGHGWVDAQQLEPGDLLRTHDGGWVEVRRIAGPMPPAPVYNMCVAEYHTYFAGHAVWGFAVWSHNVGPSCSTNAPNEVPSVIYREGGASPSNLTARPQDHGNLSFRDSLSNPITPGVSGPLGGNRPILRPGEPYIAVDTSKLPSGSVVPDGVPGSLTTPPGHVSVNNVPPEVLRGAVIPKPATSPYGPGASGKLPK